MASTIKVDNVQNQPGTNVVNKCGTTVNIGAASDNIRSAGNNLQASDGGNLISQSGTDITLGASGDTINLASGATQTGFGRTGTVDWVTTPKVTGDSPITAVTGKGYFLDTTGGVITINLPAGAAGSIVSMADYAATWQTNNVTVATNGAEKIGGETADVTLSTEGQSVTLVYVDSTQGWLNTMDSTSNVRGVSPFINATGGTPSQDGDYEIRTFTGPGTFCVTSLSPSAPENAVDFVVVAGGGAGGDAGARGAGGGGAGGYRESPGAATCYTASPLGTSPMASLTVTVQGYPITVGAGAAGRSVPNQGQNGSDSIFSTTTSAGGGGGGGESPSSPVMDGTDGGSGGGGAKGGGPDGPGGTGNTPPAPVAQGFPGGNGGGGSNPSAAGAGGGGASAAGGHGSSCAGGAGGNGVTTQIPGSPLALSGGGGGSRGTGGAGATGGTGGGGPGGGYPAGCYGTATAGTANTGGGGGGSAANCAATYGSGGSGVVIIRWKYQ